MLAGIAMSGCQSIEKWQPKAGPSKKNIETQIDTSQTGITVIDVDSRVAAVSAQLDPQRRFSDHYRASVGFSNRISAGDVVDVSIWEAPPALLFGTATDINNLSGSKEVRLPEQMVDGRGQITVPFVGKLMVAGRTPQEVQDMIVMGLTKKANNPSAVVRIAKNNSANVTVVGEVNNSTRMPLTGRGERVLDAVAAAGGIKHPTSRVTIQLNRGNQTVEMPFEQVVNDPAQNVPLQANDVVSVKYQSKSFTVLGATIRNDEVNFESGGISLMQALARSGGLNDNRADAQGVFIYRFENINILTPEQYHALPESLKYSAVVPVVFRLDLRSPASYLIAQQFAVKDKDVVYVSNAPGTEFGKFMGMISQGLSPVGTIRSITQ